MFNPLGFASLSTLEANMTTNPGCNCTCVCSVPVTVTIFIATN